MKAKIDDLEAQQSIIYESNAAYVKELKEKLGVAKEQQVDLQPIKEHILA